MRVQPLGERSALDGEPANQRASRVLSSLPGSPLRPALLSTSTTYTTANPQPGFLQETAAPVNTSL